MATASKQVYEGPRCFIGQDQDGAHGEPLEGGWFYSVVQDAEAKQIALDHAQAHVAMWGRRAKKLGKVGFVKEKLDAAKEYLAYVESASFDVPDKKLYLGDDGKFRFAVEGDESHNARHKQRIAVMAMGGDIGQPHDAESIAATHEHLDGLLERVVNGDLDPHEKGHLNSTPVEIAGAKKWIDTLPGAKS